MRIWLVSHAHTVTTFGAMLAVALIIGGTLGTTTTAGPTLSTIPSPPITLPGPEDDQDRDTYADDVDLVDGDGHIRLSLERLDAPAMAPYFVVGTQDDHWRMGAGRELEWRHIVDPDPLGYTIGSPAWTSHAIRTGAWWYSAPMADEDKIVATTGKLGDEVPEGVEWPQIFHVNVRDDEPQVTIRIELMDARSTPDRLVAAWDIVVDVPSGTWHSPDATFEADALGTLRKDLISLDVRPTVHAGIPAAVQSSIAARWAPELRFSDEERFFPTSGEALGRFHGYGRNAPADADLRTWTLDFDNGRDGYVLLLADFSGDRIVDFRDAALMTDILREGGVAPDTIYAHVFDTTGDRVVVQFWFIYMYNFVQDESGDAVEALAHNGDREFVQLTFASRADAVDGMPVSVAYSQHYRGITISNPTLTQAPFGANGTHLLVYPARGSHASYPDAGDDRRFRPALVGYGDQFDGTGEVWTVEDYAMELLDIQSWSFGHLWGPPTRHSRDLGISTKPFLQYAFRYPYIDPVSWEGRLKEVPQEDLQSWYGGDT